MKQFVHLFLTLVVGMVALCGNAQGEVLTTGEVSSGDKPEVTCGDKFVPAPFVTQLIGSFVNSGQASIVAHDDTSSVTRVVTLNVTTNDFIQACNSGNTDGIWAIGLRDIPAPTDWETVAIRGSVLAEAKELQFTQKDGSQIAWMMATKEVKPVKAAGESSKALKAGTTEPIQVCRTILPIKNGNADWDNLVDIFFSVVDYDERNTRMKTFVDSLPQVRRAAVIGALAILLNACGGGSGGGGTTGGGTPTVAVPVFQSGSLSPTLDAINVVGSPAIVANWALPANGPLTSGTLTLSCNGTALTGLTVGFSTNTQTNVGTTTANVTPAIAPGAQCTGTLTASNAGGASQPVTVRFTVASLAIPKKLFMGTSAVSNNGGVAVSVIDPATGTVTDLTQFTNQVAFFDGFCTNPVTGNVHMNARANFSGVADPNGNIRFPLYNLFTGAISAGPALGNENSVRSPVACLANGTVYYGRGTIPGTGTSTGRLEVVKNGVRTTTITLDQAGNRVPSRMVVGSGELYAMNQAPSGQASSFSVVNTTTETLTRTCPIGSEAFDMDVKDGTAYVSVFRDATSGGKDVLLFNTATCAQTGSMTMSNTSQARDVYAAGIRVTANGLYIATKEGVRQYSLPTLTQTAFFPNPSGTFFALELAIGSNEVYATFTDSTIMVLNPNLTPIRTVTKNVGSGRISASN